MMKLVEESSGIGELMMAGTTLCAVRYRVRRFQGMTEGSGLPIPGLHRIEGFVDCIDGTDLNSWVALPLSLKLQDGSVIGITLSSSEGQILAEGHGPGKCLCC